MVSMEELTGTYGSDYIDANTSVIAKYNPTNGTASNVTSGDANDQEKVICATYPNFESGTTIVQRV